MTILLKAVPSPAVLLSQATSLSLLEAITMSKKLSLLISAAETESTEPDHVHSNQNHFIHRMKLSKSCVPTPATALAAQLFGTALSILLRNQVTPSPPTMMSVLRSPLISPAKMLLLQRKEAVSRFSYGMGRALRTPGCWRCPRRISPNHWACS